MRIGVAESVQQNLRLTIGLVIAVAIGNEQQFGRRADPNTPEPNLQPTDQVQTFDEHLARLE